MKRYGIILLILVHAAVMGQGLYQKTEQFVVGNGVNFTLIHADTANAQVSINAFINYGTNSDRVATEGIAEIMSTVFTEGCEAYPKDSLLVQWAQLKTNLRISLSPVYTQLSFEVDKRNVEQGLKLMAALLAAPRFNAKWLKQELLRLKAANSVANLSTHELCMRVAAGFANPLLDLPRSNQMSSINTEGLDEVYKLYFSPVNTFIVLAGNMNSKELRKVADTTFGAWKYKFPVSPKMVVLEKPSIVLPEYAFASKPESPYTTICWMKNAPHFGAKDATAFKLALTAFQDFLMLELDGNETAKGMRFSVVYDELKNDGTYKIIADVLNEQAPDALEVFNETLYKFVDRGISDAQLRKQKSAFKSSYLNQTPADLAVFFNPILYPDLKVRKTYPSVVDKIELAAVNDALKTYFVQQLYKCTVVGPREIFGRNIADFKRYSISSFDVNR